MAQAEWQGFEIEFGNLVQWVGFELLFGEEVPPYPIFGGSGGLGVWW